MPNRLPPRDVEWIDRSQPIHFEFEGKPYTGFAGDTVSSALWANGVRVLGRSFKYHRPRGIFSLANLDANVMLESQEATNIRGDLTPIQAGMNLRAVNTVGGVDRDFLGVLDFFGPVMPVGFYYKAFHTPKRLFPFYENQIRRVAGLGAIKPDQSHPPSPKDYAFCDVLVVGGGAAGLSAALRAGQEGARVILVDECPRPGGSLLYQYGGDPEVRAKLESLLRQVQENDLIQLRPTTVAAGYYADHWIALVNEQHMTKLRCGAVVIASGCYEQPAVFRNNDLPGVMLASAAQRLINFYGVKPFSRAVALVANSDGYRAVQDLIGAGVRVATLADMRLEGERSRLSDQIARRGTPILCGHGIFEAEPERGKKGIKGAILCCLNENGVPIPGSRQPVDCDGIIISVGWAPADGLLRQAGCRMEYSEILGQFVPSEMPPGIFAAGRVNGIFDLEAQFEDGEYAGYQAAASVGCSQEKARPIQPERIGPPASHPYPVIRHPRGKNFVDLDEDLQLQDFEYSVQEGFDSPELLKRYSAVGMGPSQGKHSNLLALRILTRIQGKRMVGQQSTTARPFTTPVKLGHLAGRIFTPCQRTPNHFCHLGLNAKFMYAGTWLRPEYYPVEGLSRKECIISEARNVREKVGLIDVGTLGKLEVTGPDAVAFLESIYTGLFAKLKVGMTRYALMCDESGVVIDDGVVARMAEDRFYVSTTSSGATALYRELQRWILQLNLKVDLTNVTTQYGAMNIAGPVSREVLTPLTDISLSPDEFPYLRFREGKVAGVPARVSRIGFVGELGYEIHVPADGAVAVWNALMESGREDGIRPFGVEAQRILRLEKAHVIVGQDTDGLTTPFEAGLSWAVKMGKPFFVGQRSLAILQQRQIKRKLVGFVLPSAQENRLPKECHLVIDSDGIAGRVTSIAFSPAREQVIGLAYVRPEQSRPGTSIWIRVDGGRMVVATVVETPFHDPENLRQKAESKLQKAS